MNLDRMLFSIAKVVGERQMMSYVSYAMHQIVEGSYAPRVQSQEPINVWLATWITHPCDVDTGNAPMSTICVTSMTASDYYPRSSRLRSEC